MSEWVSFIHLSDIHFNRNSGDAYDLDEDLRNEIILDIENNAKSTIGKATGILICGDIAFSGKAKEYYTALEFLNKVCGVLEIPETSVFSVPGNHDVDQEVTKNSTILYNIQSSIEQADDSDWALSQHFRDSIGKGILYKHIEEYNTFAGKFRCNINENDPIWDESIILNEGYTLQISGLNSVIISNHKDKDKLMVIGQHQVPQRRNGVIHMTLCHHPPSFWKDKGDITKNKMNERVHVQLYGHKHMQQIELINNSLCIGSGAAHPVRWEKDWIPRYNWIMLRIEDREGEQILKIRVYPRVLNPTDTSFIADFKECGSDNFKDYTIKLSNICDESANSETKPKNIFIEQKTGEDEVSVVNNEFQNMRQLVYRFLSISYIQRTNILNKFNLIEESDEGEEHNILIDKILHMAQTRGVLMELITEVDRLYNKQI